MSPYFLLLIGMILIFIEFFLPGAVMGIIGSILVIASIVIFAYEATSPLALAAYIIAVCILLYYVAKLAIWRMQRTSSEHTICSNASQVGYVASHYDASAIGQKGVVIADLKPGGYILVDGKRQQAISVSGYITQGSQVEVIGGQEESLIVKELSES